MKLIQLFLLVCMIVTASVARADDDPVAHLKAMQGLMAAMQAEKMMRTITGTSGFPTEQQRTLAFAKLAKVTPTEIYQRLARQSRRHLSMASAQEMTRYYNSPYGKKVLNATYNSSGGLSGPVRPAPSDEERQALNNPAFVRAKKEFDKAEPAIRYEGFLLMQAINRS